MKIEYKMTKQEKNYFCIPAVFQTILRRYNQELSQEYLAEFLETTEREGTKTRGRFFSLFEKYQLKNTLRKTNEIFMQDPILLIDEWEKTNGDLYVLTETNNSLGHARLIIEANEKEAIVKDPADLSEKKENLEELYAYVARTRIGGFGLITKL